ncbi:MAG: bis(5'-nucleosyl)-tetraphosphatase (symmetrical) YqeK [Candidatus Melainabacteria bacterium]|nr:bis(5'-nucleosyl)-tetraphosphatase (symmetrical) YqeK [Candidatus Melainabacteria bacterium]
MAAQWLEVQLASNKQRLLHSLGAYEKALELAEQFACEPVAREQIGIASLLHDCAKLWSPMLLLQHAVEYQLPLSDWDRLTPQTLHPFVGAHLVQQQFGIEDPVILDAIRYHTTARAGMRFVEKIVYLADKLEGNTRNPLFVQKVNRLLEFRNPASVDQAMLFLLDSTLQFLIEKQQIIHPRTAEARNDFVIRLKETRSVTNLAKPKLTPGAGQH